MRKFIFAALAVLVAAAPAAAKDMTGMWGLGYTQSFAPEGSDLSAITARYWVDRQLAIDGLFGYRLVNDDEADADQRYFNVGARFLIKVVEEDNMHVYGGAGLALLHAKRGDDSDSGVGVNAFAGAEFFLQGLPNLGLSAEVGLGLADMGDTTTFETQGASFVNVGIRYYF